MTIEMRARPIENEVWLPAPHSDGHEVSSLGRVRRSVYAKRGGNPRVLKARALPSGYLRTTDDHYIHRLVCEAFHGAPPSNRHEVSHKDGDRANNRASNLEWVTHRENEAMKQVHGTKIFGSKVGTAKLSEAQVIQIKSRIGTRSQREIAAEFGVSQMTISLIAQSKIWRSAA